MDEKIERQKITFQDFVMIERVSHLNFLTDFERKLIDNLGERYKRFGSNLVITEKQRAVLNKLHKVWIHVFKGEYISQ